MSEWIALSELKPTEADANKHGQVLGLTKDGGFLVAQWNFVGAGFTSYTHWMPIPPPPKPAMPERLEFVKCKPGERCGEGGLELDADGDVLFSVPSATLEDIDKGSALYRRVAPAKRIVFEVTGEVRSPNAGEFYVSPVSGEILKTDVGFPSPSSIRTIVKLAEGQEYVK